MQSFRMVWLHPHQSYGLVHRQPAVQLRLGGVSALPLKAPPNPSLKRSANGRPPGPRGGSVYHPPRGPGVLPPSPA